MPPINPNTLQAFFPAGQQQKQPVRPAKITDDNEFQLFQPRQIEPEQLRNPLNLKAEHHPKTAGQGSSEDRQGLTMQELSNLAAVLTHSLTNEASQSPVAMAVQSRDSQVTKDIIKPNPPGTYVNVRV